MCWNSFQFANIIPMYLEFESTIWQFIIKTHETAFQKGIKKKKKKPTTYKLKAPRNMDA